MHSFTLHSSRRVAHCARLVQGNAACATSFFVLPGSSVTTPLKESFARVVLAEQGHLGRRTGNLSPAVFMRDGEPIKHTCGDPGSPPARPRAALDAFRTTSAERRCAALNARASHAPQR